MTITQYLEILFNDSPNPCYLIKKETKELVFINQSFKKKFQLFNDYTGKKCSEVLTNLTGPCALCQDLELKHEDFLEAIVFSKILNTNLRSNSTLIKCFGEEYLFTKFFITAIDENRVFAEQSFENAMVKCLEILSIDDQTESINSFLELLCDFYHCKLAYICEFNSTKTALTSQYVWSENNMDFDPTLLGETKVSLDHFVSWLNNDNNHRIIDLDGEKKYDISSTEHQILNKYKISNLTLNKIWNKDGGLRGIIGLSNRTEPMYDDRLLKAISRFVSERFNEKSLINALNSLSEIDLLTGFYTRSKYAEKLSKLHENPPEKLGVLFVNLNGLRQTNEYFGFEAGDEQIKNTSHILRDFFKEEFYRISGDEFVAFIPNIKKNDFEHKVSALHKELNDDSKNFSFALGHSWDEFSYSITDLVKVADTVMTINKQNFYSKTFSEHKEITNILLQELLQGIAEDEFLVYLQPQIDLSTDKVVSAEALIRRFDKKKQQMVFPDKFIPLYEQNSIIRHVDLFVVRKVCQLLQNWKHTGKIIPISVNLSRVTLLEHGIVRTISNILDEYNISHDLIIVELTERIGITENDIAIKLVDEFKSKGFRLSLDDFGCAYSNIITLAQISVDEVKIDKSLVDNLITSEKNRVIVKNMLSMCNELEKTKTLAEGIETKEQAEFLRDAHCHLGQGYLYSRPIPHEEFFEKYIKQ